MAKKKPDKPKVEEKKEPEIAVDDNDCLLMGLPNRDLYRFSEVARYLAIDERTVRNYVEHGHLEKVKCRGITWIPRISLAGFVRGTLGVKLGLAERINKVFQD